MPSIKVLNIALVLLCIMLTAFICTFLAIRSSDDALDDTKKSRDDSVKSCFAVGEDSVQNRTEEYLDLLMSTVSGHTQQFMDKLTSHAIGVERELEARTWDEVKHWDFHNLARYYWAYQEMRKTGATTIGLHFRNEMYLLYIENSRTVDRPPDEYHHIDTTINYGADTPNGGLGQYFYASVNNRTGYPIVPTPFVIDTDPTNCSRTALESNGEVPDEVCGTGSFETTYYRFLYADIGAQYPHPLWYPASIVGSYLVMMFVAPIEFSFVPSGYTFIGADLRQISQFIQKMSIGGPVGEYESRGRLFITVRSHLLAPDDGGILVAASHGNSVNETDKNSVNVIYPANSTDSIIQSVGLITEEQQTDFDGLVESKNTSTLNITTDYAPGGEKFYYRVGSLVDPFLVDWYVHVLLDREYILGSIDAKTDETKAAIDAAEKKVDDNLYSARTVLYLLVAVVAVALTVVSVIFVLRIISPLVVLEREMAMVAVMNLEGVNTGRPLSSLEEVRLMQASFLQMIDNLVEYRNYMPASVLQNEDETDFDEETVLESNHSNSSKGTSGMKKSSNGSSAHLAKNILAGTDVKQKRVTLLSCNVLGFLVGQGLGDVTHNVSDYLTMALSMVKITKGIPDGFSGDRLYVSWNGVRMCSSHKTAAYKCARGITKDKAQGRRYSIGIVSGEVKCGNMGCEGMKKYSFVGSLSSWVHIVERVCRVRGAPIAVDSSVHEEVATLAYMRSLQHVTYEKHSTRTLMVYEAMDEKEMNEEEWMYQLEGGARVDPNKVFNTSFDMFMAGNVEEAIKALDTATDDGSEVFKRYKERLSKATAHPQLCDPYGTHDELVS